MVISFARIIIGLDSQMNKLSLVIKLSLKIGMGIDNRVTGLSIEQIQLNYCSFDLLSFKLIKIIIAVYTEPMTVLRNIQYLRIL